MVHIHIYFVNFNLISEHMEGDFILVKLVHCREKNAPFDTFMYNLSMGRGGGGGVN